MKTLLIINPENAGEREIKEYFVRNAVRAAVIDEDGNVGLVHSKRNDHYKIPGGGIEKGESKITALKRECLEEIGCRIQVLDEIGQIIEYRKMWSLTQISYCYFTKLDGKKATPQYMPDEIEDGFEPVWLPYNKALKVISTNRATTFEGKNYIVPRDSFFLRAAGKLITSV